MGGSKLHPVSNHDPFRTLLVRHLHFTPMTFGIFIFILDLVVDAALGVIYGQTHPAGSLFVTKTRPPGLLQDYMALITDFIYTPVIAGIYLWATDGSTRVFQQLTKSRVFKSERSLIELINAYQPVYARTYVFYIITICSLLFSISQIVAYQGWVDWITVGGYIEIWPDASFGRAPFWFLMFYSVLYSAYNVAVTIFILRKILNSNNIQLMPLHPDNCGGLGGISQYSNKIALGIGSIGLIMSAATIMQIQGGKLSSTYPVLLGIGAYLVLAPLFFFLPLGTAHDAMQDAKDAELLKLAGRFREVYARVKVSVDKKSHKRFDEELKKLENIKKLYNLAESFPVWPFDIQNLRRFMAVVTAPLLPAIISIINEIVPDAIKLVRSWFS